MRRRELLSLVGGVVALAVAVHAQRRDPLRRVAIFMGTVADDPCAPTPLARLLQSLQQHGWTVGRNLNVEYQWTAGKIDQTRKGAAELVARAPDVIFAAGGPQLAALQQTSTAIPIVFVGVADPVAAGFVDSLARPGGNITGFMNLEYGISGQWLELLKQVAPEVKRVAVLRDLANPSGVGQFGALQSVAPSFGVELLPIGVRDVKEIEQGVDTFARGSNGGLIIPAGRAAAIYRRPIVEMAPRHRLPAVYSDRIFVTEGGLLSYGPDRDEQYGRAAGHIDRILKGEKPSDLPVEAPTKYEVAVNVKTAKALGLTVPPSLLARAD